MEEEGRRNWDGRQLAGSSSPTQREKRERDDEEDDGQELTYAELQNAVFDLFAELDRFKAEAKESDRQRREVEQKLEEEQSRFIVAQRQDSEHIKHLSQQLNEALSMASSQRNRSREAIIEKERMSEEMEIIRQSAMEIQEQRDALGKEKEKWEGEKRLMDEVKDKLFVMEKEKTDKENLLKEARKWKGSSLQVALDEAKDRLLQEKERTKQIEQERDFFQQMCEERREKRGDSNAREEELGNLRKENEDSRRRKEQKEKRRRRELEDECDDLKKKLKKERKERQREEENMDILKMTMKTSEKREKEAIELAEKSELVLRNMEMKMKDFDMLKLELSLKNTNLNGMLQKLLMEKKKSEEEFAARMEPIEEEKKKIGEDKEEMKRKEKEMERLKEDLEEREERMKREKNNAANEMARVIALHQTMQTEENSRQQEREEAEASKREMEEEIEELRRVNTFLASTSVGKMYRDVQRLQSQLQGVNSTSGCDEEDQERKIKRARIEEKIEEIEQTRNYEIDYDNEVEEGEVIDDEDMHLPQLQPGFILKREAM